mmetsp:Transcript_1520/g.2082  ORF Transcript_1520/g.2082 Transcript_1520/m.2082 type:complete len:231 (-) Transcript_1520:703-1395(-)
MFCQSNRHDVNQLPQATRETTVSAGLTPRLTRGNVFRQKLVKTFLTLCDRIDVVIQVVNRPMKTPFRRKRDTQQLQPTFEGLHLARIHWAALGTYKKVVLHAFNERESCIRNQFLLRSQLDDLSNDGKLLHLPLNKSLLLWLDLRKVLLLEDLLLLFFGNRGRLRFASQDSATLLLLFRILDLLDNSLSLLCILLCSWRVGKHLLCITWLSRNVCWVHLGFLLVVFWFCL